MQVVNSVCGKPRAECMEKLLEFIDKRTDDRIFHGLHSNILYNILAEVSLQYKDIY